MDQKKERVDPRIIRTRKMLKDALVELIQEVEIEKITVNRLAERATINRVTFYLHYRDIPDMLGKMADEMIEDLSRVLERASSDQAHTDKFAWAKMEIFLEHIADQADFYKIVLGSKSIPLFRERLLLFFTDIISSKGMKKKESHKIESFEGVNKEILIWYDSSALIGTIAAWLQNDMPYSPSFLAKQFTLLHH